MLLTVLILSAVFLSTTVIAGLLMSYQLGQVARIADSAKAIFAADTALERAFFLVFRCNPTPTVPAGWDTTGFDKLCEEAERQSSEVPFYNGASYFVTIESTAGGEGSHDTEADSTNVATIKVTGRAGKSARAFRADFQ